MAKRRVLTDGAATSGGTLMPELSWPEYEERIVDSVVLLPVGAIEQHGPHLPLGTDTYQVVAAAEAAAARVGGLVAAPLSYGYRSHPRSGGGEGFPGTTSLDASTLIAAVRNVLDRLADDGARRFVVLSGHYENRMFLHEAITLTMRHRSEPIRVLSVLWLDFLSTRTLEEIYPGAFPGIELEHAALLETSVMLHLHPDLVRTDRLPDTDTADFGPHDLYPESAMAVPPSGSLAPAAGASAAIGRIVFDECVDGLVAAIEQDLGSGRPREL